MSPEKVPGGHGVPEVEPSSQYEPVRLTRQTRRAVHRLVDARVFVYTCARECRRVRACVCDCAWMRLCVDALARVCVREVVCALARAC
eukprot:3128793-Pleurochrysis_carterae.AAC.4